MTAIGTVRGGRFGLGSLSTDADSVSNPDLLPAPPSAPPSAPQGRAARPIAGGRSPGAPVPYADDAYAGAPPHAPEAEELAPRGPRPPGANDDGDGPGSGPWVWISAILGLLILAIVGFLVFRLLTAGATPPVQQVTIPRLMDLDFAQAEAEAKRVGLVVLRFTFEPSDKPRDTVLKQDPAPGTTADKGSIVRLTLALGSQTVTIPDLRAKRESEALNLIAAAGLAIGKRSDAFDPAIPLGSIVSQDPSPGQLVAKGLSVNYVVSKGIAPTATPVATSTPTLPRVATPAPAPTPTRSPTPRPSSAPTPTPTPTPAPTPTPDATPAPTPDGTPSPSPSPSPSPTPTPTPPPGPGAG